MTDAYVPPDELAVARRRRVLEQIAECRRVLSEHHPTKAEPARRAKAKSERRAGDAVKAMEQLSDPDVF